MQELGAPFPESVKVALFTCKVAVRLPILFGAKPMVNVVAAPGARFNGSDGICESGNRVLGAARLMLEIVAALVPVF